MTPIVDPLATPDERREVWLLIVVRLTAEMREDPRHATAARQALEFALMDNPPRDWPEGSAGWHMARPSTGEPDEDDGEPVRLVASSVDLTFSREPPEAILDASTWPPMAAVNPITRQMNGSCNVTAVERIGPRALRVTLGLEDLVQA